MAYKISINQRGNGETDGNQQSVPLRFVVYHLHRQSGRLRLLRTREGHICYPEALPERSVLIDENRETSNLSIHPAGHFHELCEELAISPDKLAIEQNFRCWVETPDQTLPVFLLRVVDQQFFRAPLRTQWIESLDSCSLTPVEAQMMRKIYQWILG